MLESELILNFENYFEYGWGTGLAWGLPDTAAYFDGDLMSQIGDLPFLTRQDVNVTLMEPTSGTPAPQPHDPIEVQHELLALGEYYTRAGLMPWSLADWKRIM